MIHMSSDIISNAFPPSDEYRHELSEDSWQKDEECALNKMGIVELQRMMRFKETRWPLFFVISAVAVERRKLFVEKWLISESTTVATKYCV